MLCMDGIQKHQGKGAISSRLLSHPHKNHVSNDQPFDEYVKVQQWLVGGLNPSEKYERQLG